MHLKKMCSETSKLFLRALVQNKKEEKCLETTVSQLKLSRNETLSAVRRNKKVVIGRDNLLNKREGFLPVINIPVTNNGPCMIRSGSVDILNRQIQTAHGQYRHADDDFLKLHGSMKLLEIRHKNHTLDSGATFLSNRPRCTQQQDSVDSIDITISPAMGCKKKIFSEQYSSPKQSNTLGIKPMRRMRKRSSSMSDLTHLYKSCPFLKEIPK